MDFFKSFNIFYYLKQIKSYIDVNKIKKIVTPVQSTVYVQVYETPEAISIKSERRREILAKVVRMFSQIDDEMRRHLYRQKILNENNNFANCNFKIILDMRKTIIMNSTTLHIFRDIVKNADLFDNIELVVLIKKIDKIEEEHTEYINEFKEMIESVINFNDIKNTRILEENDDNIKLIYNDILKPTGSIGTLFSR